MDLSGTQGYVDGFPALMNVRELGGIAAAGGRTVRRGTFYRGAALTDLTPEQMEQWQAAAVSFYDLGDDFGWTPGLYDTVKAAMGAK